MIIPQGTALFRGFNNTSTLTSDFAGMDDGGKFCLHENYNVFFYPFPFVSGSVSNYTYTTLYVTMRDLKLINLILPSKYNRRDKESGIGGIVRCDKAPMGCGKKGRHFDPCVDYSKVPKDVSGVVAIAQADAHNLKMSKVIFENWINKYFATYKDSRGLVGVPEIILHPRMDKTPQTETISDFKPWYRKNKRKFNYNYLRIMSSEPGSVKQMMDAFMSDGGLDFGDIEPYHMKLNKKTGFFQIEEFSHNLSELISPNIAVSPEADLVLTRADIYDKSVPSFPADIKLIAPESIVKSKPTTVPASLTVYNKNTKAVQFRDGFVEMLSEFLNKKVHVKRTTIKGDNGEPTDIDRYLINSSPYIFALSPAGKEIERRAYETNDEKFLPDAPADVTGHPINAEISAYGFTSQKDPDNPSIKGIVSDTPSINMNNTLTQLAYTEGLLGGSRRPTLRRTTLRRRRLLKSR